MNADEHLRELLRRARVEWPKPMPPAASDEMFDLPAGREESA